MEMAADHNGAGDDDGDGGDAVEQDGAEDDDGDGGDVVEQDGEARRK